MTPVPENEVLDLVDTVLRAASRREHVATGEALEFLQRVQAVVPVGTHAARIRGIVDAAAVSFADQMVLDRCRLVDPLLDIRLALCS